MREALLKEREKGVRLDAEFSEARTHGKAENGGLHIRGWHERAGRQREDALDDRIHLRGGREQAELARAGGGDDSVGNLALHHDNSPRDRIAVPEKVHEDRRSDVVGEIAGDAEPFFGCAQGAEIDGEDIGLDDFDSGELLPQARGEVAIELNGDEAARASSEKLSDGSGTRADFDHGITRYVAECIDDGGAGSRINEKVLA